MYSEQNYLPASAVAYYERQFADLLTEMGGTSEAPFLVGWHINHSGMSSYSAAVGVPAITGVTIGTDLSSPQAFGSVQVIDIVFEVSPPIIGGLTGTNLIHFTSLVPCQKYVKVEN